MNRIPQLQRIIPTLVVLLLLALPMWAQKKPAVHAQATEDFFIISSLDAAKHRLVLKRPTEVTVLMEVGQETSYLDEQGKPLHFSDLRAGNTVYITAKPGPEGVPIVLRIRKGPMTLEELHHRYLQY